MTAIRYVHMRRDQRPPRHGKRIAGSLKPQRVIAYGMSTAPPSAIAKRPMPASERSACNEMKLIQVRAIAMSARSWPSL